MSSDNVPDTEQASNWTVTVIKCARKNWTNIIKNLYSNIDAQKLSLMPHYTIRAYEGETDSLFVSFRILRYKKNENAIVALLDNLLKSYEYEIDPKEGSAFLQHHAWTSTVGWTNERCAILVKNQQVFFRNY
jgi:hypothetical protein